MADERDRLGDKLHEAGRGREDQWARQLDAEIIARLRRRYVNPIHCPVCGKNLDAVVAIGVGGMACPDRHGAWVDDETVGRIVVRLENVAAIHHEVRKEEAAINIGELAEEMHHKHPREIDCPDCGTRLEAEAAISPGAIGLTGMACPKRHGAWMDDDMVAEIRRRLDFAARQP